MKRLVTYSLIRCVDEERDEALNVGVVVIDSSGAAAVEVAKDLTRVSRTLPHVSIGHVSEYLASLPEFFESRAGLTPAWLSNLSADWGNSLRLGEIKVATLSGSLRDVAASLARRHVEIQHAIEAEAAEPTLYRAATSMRLVNSVVGRLKKAGLEEKTDYFRDVMIQGRTRTLKFVPVWFPLRVGKEVLVDSMEVKASDEPRTFDAARLIAAKAEEAMRANGYSVKVVVKGSSLFSKLTRQVESLLRDESEHEGRVVEVLPYDKLEDAVETLPRPQLSLLAARRGRVVRPQVLATLGQLQKVQLEKKELQRIRSAKKSIQDSRVAKKKTQGSRLAKKK